MKTLQEISGPAEVTRKLLERDVQKQCVEWARARGYWCRKFSSMTQRSVPDYLFATAFPGWELGKATVAADHPLIFAVEFKKPGNTSTAAQMDEQQVMREAGWEVFECDDFEAFKRCVQELERAATV